MPSTTVQRLLPGLRLGFVLLVLAASCVGGFLDATDSLRANDTFLKKVSVAAQLTYVIFGAIAILLILTKHRNVRWPLITWAVAATVTAALSTYAWGGAGVAISLASGAVAAAITALVVWAGVHAARG
jgi:hypothetical protein